MPQTRSILVADARGIPCLQLLQEKHKPAEVSQLLVNKLHHSAEIANEKINLLTRPEKKTARNKTRHRASRRSIMVQAEARLKDLEGWMARFNGVATRYLQQYWNWYRAELNLGSLDKFLLECFGNRQLMFYLQIISV